MPTMLDYWVWEWRKLWENMSADNLSLSFLLQCQAQPPWPLHSVGLIRESCVTHDIMHVHQACDHFMVVYLLAWSNTWFALGGLSWDALVSFGPTFKRYTANWEPDKVRLTQNCIGCKPESNSRWRNQACCTWHVSQCFWLIEACPWLLLFFTFYPRSSQADGLCTGCARPAVSSLCWVVLT